MRVARGPHNPPLGYVNARSENVRRRLVGWQVTDPAAGPQQRPVRPSIPQLREVTQPESVRTRAGAEHWVASAYLRDVSPYLTRVLLRAGFSANGVTWLMIVVAGLAAVVTGWPGLVSAIVVVLLVQLQMLLDCSDGEVARWRQTSSPLGVYLDRVGHYVAECGIAVALGVRATGAVQLGSPYVSLGLLLGLLVALNKVENDLVHVARAYASLPQVRDAEDVRVPSGGLLRTLRKAARLVPFHRVFHSVELSMLVLVAAVVDAVGADGLATRGLLIGLVVAASVTVVGHLAAVLASSRLK
ncbi:MAG TPA: CDP-alcohol phosphatidyltransferase family protein [Propionibacteriaceae bacterium]|nr:CDP-alcohol phosphatidyltransferase family protein [Propionibacteriaceae bacterium]